MKAAILFLALYVGLSTGLSAQATDCNDPNASPEANAAAQRKWDSRSSPVYEEASHLAKTLNERGFQVQCMRRSVGEHLFKGQKGAVWIKTNQGTFDVWFLPTPETFAGLVVDERREQGRFLHSFRGTPQISRTIDSSKQNYFIGHENLLFVVMGTSNWRRASGTHFKSLEGRLLGSLVSVTCP
jgi:hypothetical protein